MITSVINEYCNCSYSVSYVTSTRYLCDDRYDTSIVFQGELIETSAFNGTQLVGFIQSWAKSSPTVTIEGSRYTIDGACDVIINELGVIELDGCSVGASSSSNVLAPAVVGTITGIAVASFLLLVLTITTVGTVLWRRSKKSNKR